MSSMKTDEQKAKHAQYMREYKAKNLKHRCYDVWKLIVRRCEDPRHKNFARYGARGITLCKAWHDFETFWEWAKQSGYRSGIQIDRKDNEGGYSPENCQWTTSKVNNRNRGNNKLSVSKVAEIRERLAAGQKGLHLAREYGVHHSMIYLIKKNKKWL